MNTLNIYLKESGSTAEVQIDFRLFQNAYQNKLIDIYVPISLLYTNEQNTFVTAVKTGAILTATNGARITTNSYYADYKGDQVVDGKNYAVYEQIMPKEYTVYQGEQTLVVNVINIDNTNQSTPKILSIVTSQTVQITVNESACVEATIDPSQADILSARVDALEEYKQDKHDTSISNQGVLEDAGQMVVGSLNALNTQVGENIVSIGNNSQSITDLSERVGNIERQTTPIGQMETTAIPTDVEVSAFVTSITGEAPQLNDTVTVVVNDDGVITTYSYLYTESGWTHRQIEYQQKAENDIAGLIEGTYGISGYNQTVSANVVNGQIINLYYINGNGNYEQVATRLNTNTQAITNIVNGTTIVGEAVKATEDSNGDNIAQTYAQANSVYTKSQSDEKYLPKTYTNVYYYSADGLVDEVPTTPADGIQFTANVPITGEVQLASCARLLSATYHFTKNSTDESRIWLLTDTNTTLQLRLLTYVTINGTSQLLASQLTSDIVFNANDPKEVILDSIYNNLGNSEIDVNAGEEFTKILYVTSTDNVASEVSLISSVQYASSFNLSVQSISFNVNTISGIKKISILSSQWTQNLDGSYSVTITQAQHGQAPTNQYLLTLQEEVSNGVYGYIAFTPQVDTDGNITITSDYALDCDLLIASAVERDTRGILTLTTPPALPTIDYEQKGAIKIVQTDTASALTLNEPADVTRFYSFMVVNDSASEHQINVNGVNIQAGHGVEFKWVGVWLSSGNYS